MVYRLFDADGNKVADGTTDATGKVTFSGLRLGKYAYQEISTVDGYVLDETKYDFSLTTANLNIKVTRENAPAKAASPSARWTLSAVLSLVRAAAGNFHRRSDVDGGAENHHRQDRRRQVGES